MTNETFELSSDRDNRVYVAGPMTGIEDYNFPEFIKASEMLRSQGYEVMNPADHGVVEGAEWSDYLRHDIAKLSRCSKVFFLPGWSSSKGANLEMYIATSLGMEIYYLDDNHNVVTE